MELIKWINKNINDIKGSLLFGKYFDSINIEEGADVYFLLNLTLGIDLILSREINHTSKAIP